MWTLLALHYEPTGLVLAQVLNAQACSARALRGEAAKGTTDAVRMRHPKTDGVGMGHPQDYLSPHETCGLVSVEAEQMLADMRVLVARAFAPGGHCVVVEASSVRHALLKRYVEPWKRAEEEAAKPVVPGGALKKTPAHLSNQLSNQLSNRPIAPAYVGGKKELLSAKAPEFEGAKAIREKKGLKGMNALIQARLKERMLTYADVC